ncbi:MAG: outer membrane beta-barrel protein [Muribaculaceae bacterium]|jgi:hypothetical protein|nr:outer membrane beta-barrel protein [Muribaculaceae bacterium]
MKLFRLSLRAIAAAGITSAGLLCVCPATGQSAPYKFDIGAQLGMSGYIGDANRSNPFAHPGFDGEISMRYLPDTRWALRAVLSTFSLSGDTRDISDVLPSGAAYSFSSQAYELSVRGEFNFLPYGIGETYKRLRRWSPYLTVGVGAALSASGGSTTVVPTVPMGAGIKFKATPRLNLGLEFTMTKAFGDHIDGAELADLNGIKTAFYKNTDWYSRLTIGVSYEFGPRCETCHYVE